MNDKVLELLDFVQEELEGADEYASLAKKYHGTDGALSTMYAEIASQEIAHVKRLQTRASELLGERPDTGWLWSWECARTNSWIEKIQAQLNHIKH